ncbi:MAG: ABC transporter permease [Synergistaceae bacterium]|nr:ABC transporter permease [Synergistaceae bacterium]MBR0151963.1 ABC transporter permease [Synergistaceae bacterium]MBR0258267.1 ABC transporter permease [Synergistaceae bacterium]
MWRSLLKKWLTPAKLGEFDLIIEPNKTTSDFLFELVQFRELFVFMALRDILVRYKQTVIGVAWSVIRPLLSMVIFTVIFGRVAKLPSDGVPYPIMVFSALLPWQYFANSMSSSSESFIRASSMISKIYFPRLILPTSSVLVSAVDFAISFALLCILMVIYRFAPSARMLLIPVFFIPVTVTALGVGYLFSAIGVRYRDFRHIMPFMVQFGLYVSPVGFSSSVIPDRWRLLYSLNPMVGVIDGFRWCIQGTPLYFPGFVISLVVAVLIFWAGLKYFRKTERTFADYI